MPATTSSALRAHPTSMRLWMLLLPLLAASILLLHLPVMAGTPGLHHGVSAMQEATDAGSAGFLNSAVTDSPPMAMITDAPTLDDDGPAKDTHFGPMCGLAVMLAGFFLLLRIGIERRFTVNDRQASSGLAVRALPHLVSTRVLDVQCRLSLVGTIRI